MKTTVIVGRRPDETSSFPLFRALLKHKKVFGVDSKGMALRARRVLGWRPSMLSFDQQKPPQNLTPSPSPQPDYYPTTPPKPYSTVHTTTPVQLRVPFLDGLLGGIVAVLMSVRSGSSDEPLVRGRVGFRVLNAYCHGAIEAQVIQSKSLILYMLSKMLKRSKNSCRQKRADAK